MNLQTVVINGIGFSISQILPSRNFTMFLDLPLFLLLFSHPLELCDRAVNRNFYANNIAFSFRYLCGGKGDKQRTISIKKWTVNQTTYWYGWARPLPHPTSSACSLLCFLHVFQNVFFRLVILERKKEKRDYIILYFELFIQKVKKKKKRVAVSNLEV